MAVGVVAILYGLKPEGSVALAYVATSMILLSVVTVAPIVRGAQPRRVWVFEGLGGLCLLLALLREVVQRVLGPDAPLGPFADPHLLYYAGYLFFILWLGLLCREAGTSDGRGTFIDAWAVTAGSSLAVWILFVAPIAGGPASPRIFVDAAIPVFDVTLVALAVTLAVRLQTVARGLVWLIATLFLLLFLDVVSIGTMLITSTQGPAWIRSGYLFVYLGLAHCATHPTAVDFWGRTIVRGDEPIGRPTALIVFTVSPAILATAVPFANTPLDAVVRTTLIALLLALLFVRLSRTMAALSQAEVASRRRALHDPLTGLPNRAALVDILEGRLARNSARRRSTAVLFLDCDDFKAINDTWGHQAGDLLLRHVAEHLPAELGPSDVLARHGGDEFVILSTVDDPSDAVTLAERVQRFFAEPFRVFPGRAHVVTSSVGIAVAHPDDGSTTDTLLSEADLAMYETKQLGGGRWTMFDNEFRRRSRTRMSLGDRLAEAIRTESVRLAYQPIMGGPGYGTVLGWEALARWRDDDGHDIPPDVFIPLAERLSLIDDLGESLLRRACTDLARLQDTRSDRDLAVFVNVSPSQLRRPRFANLVLDACVAAGISPQRLRLELTETTLIDQQETVSDTLRSLRELGVRICLDDFGSGYASLSTLLELPLDVVKLDRSLVSRLDQGPQAVAQLGAIISLVRSLGIEAIVAEGIETREQADTLAGLRCPAAQGWLYAYPAPVDQLLDSGETQAEHRPATPLAPSLQSLSCETN